MDISMLRSLYSDAINKGSFNSVENEIAEVRMADADLKDALGHLIADLESRNKLSDLTVSLYGACEMQGFMMGAKVMAKLFSEVNSLFPAVDGE